MRRSTVSKFASPHLRWTELACRDGSQYPEQWRKTRLPELLTAFEWIREKYGAAICVSSAYRTASYNRRIGGARHSQHVQGRALDIMPCGSNQREKLEILRDCVLAARAAGLLSGVGFYRDFIHIDTRPVLGVNKYTWGGSRDNTGNQIA